MYISNSQSIVTNGLLYWGTSKYIDRVFKAQKKSSELHAADHNLINFKFYYFSIFQAILYIKLCSNNALTQADIHFIILEKKYFFTISAHSQTFKKTLNI